MKEDGGGSGAMGLSRVEMAGTQDGLEIEGRTIGKQKQRG